MPRFAWARDDGDVDLELQLGGVRRALLLAEPRPPHRGAPLAARTCWPDPRAPTRDCEPGHCSPQRRSLGGRATTTRCEELAARAQTVFERLDDRALLAMALDGTFDRSRVDGATSTPRWRTPTARSASSGSSAIPSALDAILNNRGYAEIIAGNFESAERRLRELAESAIGTSRLCSRPRTTLSRWPGSGGWTRPRRASRRSFSRPSTSDRRRSCSTGSRVSPSSPAAAPTTCAPRSCGACRPAITRGDRLRARNGRAASSTTSSCPRCAGVSARRRSTARGTSAGSCSFDEAIALALRRP